MTLKGLVLAAALVASHNVHAAKEAAAGPQNFEIDTVHTFVLFKVNHLGFSNTFGRFTDVKGTFSVDEAKPENTKIDITIDTASLDTQDKKRDTHLKGPDFFNVKANPKITFKSKTVKKKGDVYEVTGDLSMNGKTQPVTFDFKRQRTGTDPWGNTKTGGDFSFKIKRSQFGMNYMQGENQISDDVEIIASVEGNLKK